MCNGKRLKELKHSKEYESYDSGPEGHCFYGAVHWIAHVGVAVVVRHIWSALMSISEHLQSVTSRTCVNIITHI